ncbi:MAG: hypothetical protein LBP99_04285 [Azoarcus sp.]|jgi:aspartyl-tRNA(Asn)/glutamyl-tRNA(Gln) amidotransferase subunit A|nr:hypothetical protein [Azoarcus sp.]
MKPWTSIGMRELSFDQIPSAEGLRIGLLAEACWDDCAPLVRQGMKETTNLLAQGGFEIRQVDFDVRPASQVGAFFYRFGCRATVQAIAEA